MAKWMPSSAEPVTESWKPASAIAVESQAGAAAEEPQMGTLPESAAQDVLDIMGPAPEYYTPERIQSMLEGPGKAVVEFQDSTGMDMTDIMDTYDPSRPHDLAEWERQLTRRKYTNIITELGYSLKAGGIDIGAAEYGTVSAAKRGLASALRYGPFSDRATVQKWIADLDLSAYPWDEEAQRLHDWAQSGEFMPGEGGGSKAFLANAVGRTLPLMSMSTVAAIGTGGTSLGPSVGAFLSAAFVERETIYREALASGGSQEQAQLEGVVGGTINGVIEIAQVSKILRLGKGAGDPVLKEFAAAVREKSMQKILKSGAKVTTGHISDAIQEGFEEVAQQWVGEGLAITVHGKPFPAMNDALTMTGQAFAGGAGAGFFLGLGTLVVEGSSQSRDIAQADERAKAIPETPKPDMVMTEEQLAEFEMKLIASEQSVAAPAGPNIQQPSAPAEKEADRPVAATEQKQPWEMTAEEYAWSLGAQKPEVGLDSDVSFHQLSRMSEAAKSRRTKEKVAQRKKARGEYDSVVTEWKEKVWNAYVNGEFSSNDVFNTEAFYVLSERFPGDSPSPFRLNQMDDGARKEILSAIDSAVRDAALAKQEATNEPALPPESGAGLATGPAQAQDEQAAPPVGEVPKGEGQAQAVVEPTVGETAGKQAWEMRRDKFKLPDNSAAVTDESGNIYTGDHHGEAYMKMQEAGGGEPPVRRRGWMVLGKFVSDSEANHATLHSEFVKEALRQNRPVPRAVLEEYSGEKWADAALAKLEKGAPNAEVQGQTQAEKVGTSEPAGTAQTEQPTRQEETGQPAAPVATAEPVEGPQRKVSRAAGRVQEEAIAKDLVESLGEIPTYETMSMKDQARMAAVEIASDYENAKRMAYGQVPPPSGLRPASIYRAVAVKARTDGDVETLRNLAVVHPQVSLELTAMGQAIKAADVGTLADPVKAMQDVQKAKEEAVRKRRKVNDIKKEKATLAKEAKHEIRTKINHRQSWSEFAESLRC